MVGQKETGNETYVRGLVSGLASIEGVSVAAAIAPAGDRSTFPASVETLPLPSPSSWHRLAGGLAALCRAWRCDVAHATYIAPYRLPCPVALSVHDVSFRRFPEFFSARDRFLFRTSLPHSLSRAAAVVTLSSHARREIETYYPGCAAKTFVVPGAPAGSARLLDRGTVGAVLAKYGVMPPFLLAVGNLQPRKNLLRLIDAYDAVRARHSGVRLVIVGPDGFKSSQVHEAVALRGLSAHVQWLGYVTDDELAGLYNAAVALVYPSIYEGFGLPAVEAMACGCPVIAANSSSLPEVVGDAGVLVDPLNVPALSAAIEQVLTDPDLARGLRARGLARAATFSWRQSAEAALAAYAAARASRVPRGPG